MQEPEICEDGGKTRRRRLLLADEDISRATYALWLLGHCTSQQLDYGLQKPGLSFSRIQNTVCILGFMISCSLSLALKVCPWIAQGPKCH